MTALHAYFHQRNQQAFQRLLDPARSHDALAGGLSTSGGKSWSRPSPLSSAPSCDVNAKDHLGRTVLHLAASSSDTSAPEYVRMLLAHPTIHVNLPDAESHWTALHRALYHGNIANALLLLQKPEIDTKARDIEGYTPFDLYNSTIEGTIPFHQHDHGEELYTWGSNRNAALGVADGDDRTVPELVSLRAPPVSEKGHVDARFTPIRVRQIAMSKLHTVIVTNEPKGNLRICGFGSGGRLGPGQHTQYSPIPLPGFNHTVSAVALGQDHTLALVENGEVYSWGLNRFAQLGYVAEMTTGGRVEEPVQSVPRKITGAIRNRRVIGIAACKTASACWTVDEVFTWGTNSGQLGYDRAAQPVQVAPRVVTKITKPVLSLSITDHALACLLESQEVICLWNDGHFKVNFPAYSFPSEFVAYRPPQAANRSNASIDKVTSCEDTFAALSSSGEVFTFSLPAVPEASSTTTKTRFNVQPQRVWALRKKFSAVRDVALGVDGSIIICTESGHVFVRSRNMKAGQGTNVKAFKFQRIPHIQRVTRVCANATGAFAALRSDWVPQEINIVGNRLEQDLASVQPYLHMRLDEFDENSVMSPIDPPDSNAFPPSSPIEVGGDSDKEEAEEEDASVYSDIKQLKSLCLTIVRLKNARKVSGGRSTLDLDSMPCDADLIVHIQSTGIEIPAHRPILAARSSVLYQVLSEGKTIRESKSNVSIQGHFSKSTAQKHARLTITGCHPLSVLILLVYLYSDESLALWDYRIGHAIQRRLEQLKIKPAQVKNELQALASLLELSAFAEVLDAPVKRTPKSTLSADLSRLFGAAQTAGVGSRARRPCAPDVILQLAEREVFCHSVILRARSPFFAAFFGDKDWTVNRWTSEGTVIVNLKHMKWRAMEPVLRYLCSGIDKEIFDVIEDVGKVEGLIEYVFDVMAIANELHMDRLMLICSWVITKRVWINNACSILTDAMHYHAQSLIRLLQEYVSINMELFLESRMLDDLGADLIKQLSAFVRIQQAYKYPVSRSTRIVDKAMDTWGEWLALQDIPQPIVPSFRVGAFKDSPKLSPPGSSRRATRRSAPSSPMLRPTISSRPVASGIPDDEMFMMDSEVTVPPLGAPISDPGPLSRVPSASEFPARPSTGWKTITSAPKTDMKAIMAEASSIPRVDYPGRPIIATASRSQDPSLSTPPRTSLELPTKGGIPRVPSGSWRAASSVNNSTTSTGPVFPDAPSLGKGTQILAQSSAATSSNPHNASASTSASPRSQSQSTTPRKAPAPGLGPVFTPTKQAPVSATSSIRRTSSGNVWTPLPVQPVVQPSPSGAAVSFAAIQLAQAEQNVTPTQKGGRSLVEIQEEERERQAEEDFLRWWAAEEERVRAEEVAASALPVDPPKKPKKPRPGSCPGHRSKPSAGSAGGRAKQDMNGKGTDTQRIAPEDRPGEGRGGKPPRRRRPQNPDVSVGGTGKEGSS